MVCCVVNGGGEPRCVVVNLAKDIAGKYDDVDSVGGEVGCCCSGIEGGGVAMRTILE